ncbi:MAG: tryptophan--tRNA ligase [Patescibacteria group bacterium]|nr:tryptophan--tRNA ligase [Patescibacteria group bacterium]
MDRKIILTGDRPTGPLHLGHFVGSLKQRVELQNEYETYILIADQQALTDNANDPRKVHNNIIELALDYLAVGINPEISTIVIQSQVPEIAELTMYYMNLVTLARLRRNPTVKNEMQQKGFNENVPVGFLTYPISQAADITAFGANLVPVGADQLPMIEQTAEIVRKFNSLYGETLVEPKALVSEIGRLPGLDGKAKMSKSLNNAIYLSDKEEVLKNKVMSMYTDPGHVRKEDPGKIEGNMVFVYLEAFDQDKEGLKDLKERYQKGGVGDVEVKERLFKILNEFLAPIRAKRSEFAADKEGVMKMIIESTARGRVKAQETLSMVKKAMMLDYN